MHGTQLKMPADRDAAVASALRTVTTEHAGLAALQEALASTLGAAFAEAIARLSVIQGRVVVTGVGKSGHIANKLAATLASTGTPSFFVHPSEANHGDLGMIARSDAVLAISWSGETIELKGILAYTRRFSIPLVAITAGEKSALARAADVVLVLPRAVEACPLGLAPTTSTMLQLSIGDAIAVALLEARGFTADNFRTYHPGGQLGANLTVIRDVMHGDDRMPLVRLGTSMREAILEISRKGFGCVGIIGADDRLTGIITDGDLRRHIDDDLLAMTVDDVMTDHPKTIEPTTLAATALGRINESSITALFVAQDGKPVGIVHLHDLLRLGVA